MKTYNNPNGIRRAIAEVLKIEIEEVELAYTGEGFVIVKPEGAELDEQEVANWTPPVIEPTPIEPVEQFKQVFASAVSGAQQKIVSLKASCCVALMAAGMTRDDAVSAGVAFAMHPSIKAAISDYELVGGHPLAAAALKQAAVDLNPSWLTEGVLALFDELQFSKYLRVAAK